MTLSRNEIEAIAKRAARGAGYPWGIAEEAGRAVRWLCARGLDGGGALAMLLAAVDGAPDAHAPRLDGRDWRAAGEALCPLLAGCALSDRADALGAEPLRLHAVAAPLLLVPFVAAVARHRGAGWRIGAGDASLVTDGTGIILSGAFPCDAADCTLAPDATPVPVPPPPRRAAPDPATLAALEAFGHRTYAPATAESRRRGAGGADGD